MKLRPWEFGDADAPRAKALFAGHLGSSAAAADVAVTPSAAYAVSTVAGNTALRPGDEVVLLEEHYASVLPWQHAAAAAGAVLVPVARGGSSSPTAALLAAITPRTAVVTAAPCGWTDGAVVDLVAVGAACRAAGAALVLDATQWVGAMPFDLDAIKPDAVVASVHNAGLRPQNYGASQSQARHRFCYDFLYSVLLLNAILGVNFLGLARSSSRCTSGCSGCTASRSSGSTRGARWGLWSYGR
jgi:selenocysteine lyase/cysteine desulfurase